MGVAEVGMGAAALLGGIMSSSAQSDAAQSAAMAQQGQGENAIAFQREMFNKLLELNQPFYNIGTGAIPAYMNYLGLSGGQQTGGQQQQGYRSAVPPDLDTMMQAYEAYRQANTAQVPETVSTPGGLAGSRDEPTGRMTSQFNGLPLDQWLLQQVNTPQATTSTNNLYPDEPPGGYRSDYVPRNDGAVPPTNNLSRTVTPWTRFNREGSQDPTAPIVRSETFPEAYRPDHIPTLDTSGYTGYDPSRSGMDQYGPALNSPMYQWRLQEGTNALNNALRARGKFDSTAGLRSIGDLTNQLTAEETEKSYNRLLDAIKIGSGAAGTAGAGAIQTGQGVASSFNQTGNALAAGQQGQGQAWGSFYGGLGGLPMQLASMNYLMNKPNYSYGNPYDEYYR